MSDSKPSHTTRRFRMLLRLLPAEFRGDYGPEMEQVFKEQRADAERHGDKMGIWRLWWETAKGIFTTAPREHLSMLRQDSGFALRSCARIWVARSRRSWFWAWESVRTRQSSASSTR